MARTYSSEWNKAHSWYLYHRKETFMAFFTGYDNRNNAKLWLYSNPKDLKDLLDFFKKHGKQFLALVPYKEAERIWKEVQGKSSYSRYFRNLNKCVVCGNEQLKTNKELCVKYCPKCERFFLSATLNKEMD